MNPFEFILFMIASAMVLEGFAAFAFPERLLRKMEEMLKISDPKKVRRIGLICVVIGTLLITLIGIPR